MSRARKVRVTQNFERNLGELRAYHEERGMTAAFDALLGQLFDTIIPNLESFPEIGFDFLARKPQSVEGLAQVSAVRRRLGKGAAVREYIAQDYLILYAVLEEGVALLSIKHHLQLSFDLRGHWSR